MYEVVEYKLIEGYDDYMVSSDGKVWSLKYGKMKELRPRADRDGYLRVCLCINGRRVEKRIHRLVAQAFVTNPDDEPEVNHKDEDKTNNSMENLEWCSRDYNCNFGSRNERVAKAHVNHKFFSKPVVCLETGVVYPSTREASRQTGTNQSSISSCLSGRYKTAGGYHWARFVEGKNPIYE